MGLTKDVLKMLGSTLKTWVADVFWPWFIKEIWPEIQKYIVEVVLATIGSMAARIMDYSKNRNKQHQNDNQSRQEKYQKKADEAAEGVKNAKTPEEAQQYKERLALYEEFLSDLRQQNQQLRQDMDELRKILEENIKETQTELNEKLSKEPPEHLNITGKISEQVQLLVKE